MKLTYAAYARCPCGAGIAHGNGRGDDESGRPISGYWDCSEILLGTAREDVTHTAKLPFVFYEIKSERQPSAEGTTTRPQP